MRRLNILFINQYYYPDLAATAQLLTELCESLARRNNVTVVAGFPSYNPQFKIRKRLLLKAEKKSGVRIIRVFSSSFSRIDMLARLCNYATFLIFSILGGLFSGKQDIIVTMTDPAIVGLVGFSISKIKRVPFVYISQDVFPEAAVRLGKLNNKFMIWVLYKLNRFLLKKADAVVAIGKTMKKYLVKKGAAEDKIVIIENWADTESIKPCKKPNWFSDKYNLNGRFVVMHSGNTGLSQNLDLLIETARILEEERKIAFLIVGDGAYKEKLRNKANDYGLENVIFLPYQEKSNLKYSLSCADVHFVSLKKGLAGFIVPSKIYNIMASGRAVIAALEGECEVAEVIRESGCGLVIEPGDAKALTEKILHLFNQPEKSKIMGRNGRIIANKKYSKQSALNKYQELLKKVVFTRRYAVSTKQSQEIATPLRSSQ